MESMLSVSINSVARSIYAQSALKSFMTLESEEMPPLLSHDNRAALGEAIRSVAHLEIGAVFGRSSSVVERGEDFLDVSFRSRVEPSLSLVKTLESMLALKLLARLFSSIDREFAEGCAEEARRTAESVRMNLYRGGDPGATGEDEENLPIAVSNVMF